MIEKLIVRKGYIRSKEVLNIRFDIFGIRYRYQYPVESSNAEILKLFQTVFSYAGMLSTTELSEIENKLKTARNQ